MEETEAEFWREVQVGHVIHPKWYVQQCKMMRMVLSIH